MPMKHRPTWVKMKKTIRGTALIGLAILSTGGSPTCAQQSANIPRASQAQAKPTLLETIQFMDRSVRPESGYVASANHCEVYVTRNKRYAFAVPQGKSLKSTDQFGVRHYGINWLVVQEPEATRFEFSAIDPSSIKSNVLPSPAFLKEHNLDEDSSALKEADLTVVFFNSADATNSIEQGHFKTAADGSIQTPEFDHSGSIGYIVFESKDRAERFVTAFEHAVELCGGKGSEFAPTPSKP